MNLKCIIFDVDGTMADTERDGHRVAFNLAFKEKKLDWQWDEELYGELLRVTGGKERLKYYQIGFLKKLLLTDVEIKNMHACKTKHYLRLLKAGKIPLRHGVQRLIKQAKSNNIRLAISTTTTLINVRTLLKNTLGDDAEQLFEIIAAGDIVPYKKPAPDIYNYVLTNLGLKATECITIEDSSSGLTSSVQAGIKTIVTTNSYTENQDFSKAEAIYPNFNQINIQYLNQLIGQNHV